eukprot:Amastigsp_a510548_37.p5 type:complete len:101 gc:universal Amastigsp_a510548_37:331-633(+)
MSRCAFSTFCSHAKEIRADDRRGSGLWEPRVPPAGCAPCADGRPRVSSPAGAVLEAVVGRRHCDPYSGEPVLRDPQAERAVPLVAESGGELALDGRGACQ